jgi:hypothetical protein
MKYKAFRGDELILDTVSFLSTLFCASSMLSLELPQPENGTMWSFAFFQVPYYKI